jgi:hypothetical protein
MIVIPWNPPYTREQLDNMSNPVMMNQPEVVPWQLYDTASIATAAAGPFTFFTALNADKTLCNMEGPGQLPDPQYFILQYIAADWLQPAAVDTGAVVATNLANLDNILKTARATITLNVSNKRYGPFSLTTCHSTGGATGSGWAEGATAAGAQIAAINNGIPGSGGFPIGGSVVIPPKIGFDITVNLGVAATLTNGPVNLRISMFGALYRRVL